MHRILPLLMIVLVAPALAGKRPSKRPSDIQRGEELYNRHCIACHGEKNDGQGPAAKAMVAVIPGLVGQVKASEPMVKTVLRGKSGMPGYETSFDRYDARRVLRYMATLGGVTPVPAPEDPDDADPLDEEEDGPIDDAPAEDAVPE